MYLELDGQGPKYLQLVRALKAAVLDGRIGSGSRLPPSRTLAQELGVSRNTVITTYEQLEAEGFVASRVGSGTFVTEVESSPPVTKPAGKVSPQTHYAKRARETQNRLISRRHYGLRYNLTEGEPLVDPLLIRAWSRELARAAANISTDYPGPYGLRGLRAAVCDYLGRRRGVHVEPEQVLIVHGTQQALNLSARVLLNEKDRVVLEEPHYFSARQVFQAHGAKIIPIPTDEEGLNCDQLPAKPPRLIYVTPSHQYPGGSVMSLPRRLELLRYTEKQRCWILEDDYDGEFRYGSRPLAALRSLDQSDRIIYVGSFSKVLFPALRLGYMVIPTALYEDFAKAKWLADMGCGSIEQAAMAHFIESGGFDLHLRRMGKTLKARREALLEGLRRYVGDRVQVVNTHAGMHLVIWLRGFTHARAEALIALAHERGLGLYPLTHYYFNPPPTPGLLLGYAGLPPADLTAAMRLLGQCLDEVAA